MLSIEKGSTFHEKKDKDVGKTLSDEMKRYLSDGLRVVGVKRMSVPLHWRAFKCPNHLIIMMLDFIFNSLHGI